MKTTKRILSSLIAGVLLCAGSVFPTASAEETYLRGDTNYDGVADAEDARDMLIFFAFSLVQEDGVVSEEEWEAYCEEHSDLYGLSTYEGIVVNDMNGDGAIDVTDAFYVLRFYCHSLLHLDWTTDEIWAFVDAEISDDYEHDYVVNPDEWL